MESKGLEALERIKRFSVLLDSEKDIVKQLVDIMPNTLESIEKELKAKANLVSMCENLTKLVGLKEKDYVELETLITKKLKALEQLEIMYSNCVIEGAKQKKALEIINKKQVNIFLFKECCKNKWKMPYSYNQSQNKRRQLNEEEYGLLKEVLK